MANRFYTFEGDDREYVSVTTFLSIIAKPFLVNWAAKMERKMINLLIEQGADIAKLKEYTEEKSPYGHKYALEASSAWGQHVHKAIETYLKTGKTPKLTKDERKSFDKWLEWWKGSDYYCAPDLVEYVVKSSKHGYAGTEDAKIRSCYDHKKYLIADWKTGNYHYKEHVYQNYAYQMAEWEIEGNELMPVGGLLVYIPKDYHEIVTKELPKPELKEILTVLNALGLWREWNNKPWKE